MAFVSGRPLGVYVHFPWCVTKCPYCDFFSVESRHGIAHQAYAQAVISEFDQRSISTPPAGLRSIYFGGGTPSLWEVSELGRVIEHILRRCHSRASSVEITVECNPHSFDADKCRSWKACGVNRLSLGLQSLNDEDLRYLGRAHDAKASIDSLQTALDSGIERVCADLIYGLPYRMPSQYERQVRCLPLAALSHLSAYALTVEHNTPFGALARQGRLATAPDESVVDTFLALHEVLGQHGFEHYEISNYARAGQRSRHNCAYWHGDDYLGLGVAAWGTVTRKNGSGRFEQRVRYRNTPRIEHYLRRARECHADEFWELQPNGILSEIELLDAKVSLSERFMLGLRTIDGLNLDDLSREFDIAQWLTRNGRALTALVERGRLKMDPPRIYIPFDMWCLADGTIARLM